MSYLSGITNITKLFVPLSLKQIKIAFLYMQKSINEIQDDLIEEFSLLDDWMDRYELIITLGNELSLYQRKIKCQSI